ncbi:putative chromosome organization and biogenesis-related protein [Naematelia encephala]|uniref:Ribosome biogenesis protein YTM1 n=1 Tax=Naematelia encephala TaxID=71784 RepID=A0A1Y2BAB6_9TREE|nr:putative chromosome organization and biogenesis-related protein [Naematelia encephala]
MVAEINMEEPAAAAPRALQLPISLFTRHSDLTIPQSTYMIPSSWRRYQLSELINKVLSLPTPVPFDFLVEGEVLRGSLDAWVKRNRGGDEEGEVRVEYVRSMMPPEESGRIQQEDWVSGLSLARPGYILVSSYLSHLRILPLASTSSAEETNTGLYTLPLPNLLGATCCTYLSPQSVTSDIRIAAGGVDRSVHVFQIPSLDADVASSSSGRELYTLMGHTGPISSIAASSNGSELVSASWDGALNYYALPEEEPTEHTFPAEPTTFLPGQKKRRRLNGDAGKGAIEGLKDGDVGAEGWRRGPDGVMRGHKGRVGGIVWDKNNGDKVWSGGWDGSVRGWEVGSGANAVIRQGPSDKSILCIDQFRATGTLATGSMDRTICLWDTQQATSLISLTLPTSSPVAAIACHPTNGFTLASATYHGQIQIWDVRSPKSPLFTAQKQGVNREVTQNGKRLGERLLALDWDGEVIVAGGEDGEVGIWRARGE